MGIIDYFRNEKPGSASVARDRLKLIVAHERKSRNQPDYLPQMQRAFELGKERLADLVAGETGGATLLLVAVGVKDPGNTGALMRNSQSHVFPV